MDIRDATAIQKGATSATGVYVGAQEIWTPGGGPTQYTAAQFVGDGDGANLAVVLGGVGCTNFEVQALVYMEGAYTSEDRVFMLQFAAGRQCGLFVSNLTPSVQLVTGDSQEGSTGGTLRPLDPTLAPQGVWMLLTFSADGLLQPNPLAEYHGSMESLDRTTVTFSSGGRHKGVEDSLTVERFDLNGGTVENGWPNGIRFAEVRGYNAQRDDNQRQLDLTNTDPSGAVFWWRFSDAGGGVLAVTDITGNGNEPDVLVGSAVVGPLF